MIVSCKAACISPVMRKGKIICHIVNDFSKTPPVHSLIVCIQPGFHQLPHSVLNLIKGSKKLMSLCQKRRFDIRKDASQAERFPV